MRIACWGYYGKKNLGDDLILQELLKRLAEYAFDAEITVFSDSEISPAVRAEESVRIIARTANNLIRASFREDILICGPGGLMPQRNSKKLLFWILIAIIMRIRGKKLLIVGLGIGQQNFECWIDRSLLRIFSALACSFAVRQADVQTALNTNRILQTADVVFTLNLPKYNLHIENMSVAFALANVFGGAEKEEYDLFLTGMANTINDLLNVGYKVYFVEFTKDLDMQLYKELLNRVPNAERIIVCPYTDDPKEIIEVFHKVETCVCMRYHALVLAAIANVPSAIISYGEKTDDLAERLGLKEYAMPICPNPSLYYGQIISFDEHGFRDILKKTLDHRQTIKKSMLEKLPEMRALAMKNWDELAKYIKTHDET